MSFTGGMTFSMNRPTGERCHVKAIPRAIRKPAPTGTTRALDETLVGNLDCVADAKSQSAPNYRRPLARHLVESLPTQPKPSRHQVARGAGGGVTPPQAASLCSTATLVGGLDLDSSTTLRRGKKVVETNDARVKNFSLFKPASPGNLHAGKRIFSDKLQEETAPAANTTLHKKPVPERQAKDTPTLLRFSPRQRSARPSTAPPVAAAAARPSTSTRGAGRPSEGMRGVLSWTGATPRYGALKVSHNLRPTRPSTAAANASNAPQLSATRINPPFDSSFRQPVAGVPSEANARRRGPQKVTVRPKTARGLLRWD